MTISNRIRPGIRFGPLPPWWVATRAAGSSIFRKPLKDVVGHELVQVGHIRLPAELELHLAQAREPQLKLGVQVERARGLD